MNHSIHEDEFLIKIEALAVALSNGDVEKIYSLRKVVRSISIFEAARDWEKMDAVFLLYFLNKFINDVWRHFGTDAPFEDITDVVSEISKQLGQSLLGILPQVRREEPDQTYNELNLLIKLYFNKLVFIETILEKKYDLGCSILPKEGIVNEVLQT